jgi:hypothetical protein
MGVTLQRDYCYHCHADIGRERPSHASLSHQDCGSAGCHNFHDNRALYEDQLVAHASEPALLAPPRLVPARPWFPPRPLRSTEADAPPDAVLTAAEVADWERSAHARGGVNCSGCHQTSATWNDDVPLDACAKCHAAERDGWGEGRHGMRVAAGLNAMTPGQARAPMHPEVSGQALGCTSCHGAHRFDPRQAAAAACQTCHADGHSLAYPGSPHHRTWLDEQSGSAAPGSGVSCATCHMPRLADERGRVFVEHNQNDNLRPNDKMIRSVCANCHGLAFSIDALADADLVQSNFRGSPRSHVPSVDWALARTREAAPSTPPPRGN